MRRLDQLEGKGSCHRLVVYPVLMLIVPAISWRTRFNANDREDASAR